MHGIRLGFLVGASLVGIAAAHATWYTNEASFVSAINSVYYLEDFNDFTFGNPLDGSQNTWQAPGANGYGWSASANLGLFSNDGALSTNVALDPIVLTFAGNPVTAFGAILADTGIDGSEIAGTETLTLSDGESQSIDATTDGFLGWVGGNPISGVTMTVTGSGGGQDWNQMDHVYTGAAAVPEPLSVAGVAAGLLALLRRRRR